MPQDPQQQGGLPGLLGALQSGMQSPLFQQGLGTYNAGASGQNWAGGLLAGQKSYQDNTLGNMTLKQHQMALDQATREAQQAQQRDAYIQNLNPNDPQFKGLPPALISMSKGMGDPSILAKGVMGKMDLDQQMAVAKAQGDVKLQLELQQKKAEFDMINRLYGSGAAQPGSGFPSAYPSQAQPATGGSWSIKRID
jgi:hypothetical protein